MRLSVDKDDPGYKPELLAKSVRVFVNGIQIAYCVTADEEKRVVYCHVEEEHSKNLKRDPVTRELVVVERRGDVAIVFDDEPSTPNQPGVIK